MRVKVMGKRWLLVLVAKGVSFIARRDKDGREQRMGKADDGLTEGPWLKQKRMFLRHGMREKRKLETAIHEFMHAADWSKDEEWVLEFGHDLANFLYALGLRFSEPGDQSPDHDPETLDG